VPVWPKTTDQKNMRTQHSLRCRTVPRAAHAFEIMSDRCPDRSLQRSSPLNAKVSTRGPGPASTTVRHIIACKRSQLNRRSFGMVAPSPECFARIGLECRQVKSPRAFMITTNRRGSAKPNEPMVRSSFLIASRAEGAK